MSSRPKSQAPSDTSSRFRPLVALGRTGAVTLRSRLAIRPRPTLLVPAGTTDGRAGERIDKEYTLHCLSSQALRTESGPTKRQTR